MAKVRVKIEGKSVLIEVFPRRGYGGRVFDEDPNATPWKIPRLPGRPPEDARAQRVAELRAEEKSWACIHKELNRELGLDLTKDAYRKLFKPRIKQHARHGTLYAAFLQHLGKYQENILHVPRLRGRPRKDRIRLEGRQMHRNGKTWGQIAVQLNTKYHQELSPEAYRKLCSPVKHVAPWRKLDLNIIRGLKRS